MSSSMPKPVAMDNNPSPASSPDRWVTVRRPPTAMTKRSKRLKQECTPSTAENIPSCGLAGGDWWSDAGPPDSPPPQKPVPISLKPWRYRNLRNPDRSGTSSLLCASLPSPLPSPSLIEASLPSVYVLSPSLMFVVALSIIVLLDNSLLMY